jgi:hypothetical protein
VNGDSVFAIVHVFRARRDVRLPFAQLRVIIWMVAEAEVDLILEAGVICGCATPLWSLPRFKKSKAQQWFSCSSILNRIPAVGRSPRQNICAAPSGL